MASLFLVVLARRFFVRGDSAIGAFIRSVPVRMNLKLAFADSRRWVTALLLLAFTLPACASREPPMILKSGELPFGGNICRVAVLPFLNQSGFKMAEVIVGRVFVAELVAKGGYLVAHEGDVRRILTQMKMLPGEELSSEQIRGLADRLGVQIIVSGSVLEGRDKSTNSNIPDPSLAVVLRIMEASSGRMLWITYNRIEGNDYRIAMHFGLINSMSELAKKVSAEIIDAWEKEGLKKCTE